MHMLRAREVNPYEPPAAEGDYDLVGPLSTPFQVPLATLWQRGFGAFIDAVLPVVACTPSALLSVSQTIPRSVAYLVLLGALIPVLVVQAYLITKSGQSIGKKVVRIKIVRQDGSVPGFVQGVLLRSWLAGAMSVVPVLGVFFVLVDVLMVFRVDRRCLHDLVAGTSVVQA